MTSNLHTALSGWGTGMPLVSRTRYILYGIAAWLILLTLAGGIGLLVWLAIRFLL